MPRLINILVFVFILGGTAPRAEGEGPDNTENVEIQSIAEGVWVHTSYHTFPSGVRFPSNGLIVKEGDTLTLVDTAWGEAATNNLLNEIANQIGLKVSRAIVTHHHEDRVGGVGTLQAQNIKVYAHPMTRELVAKNGTAVPDQSLDHITDQGTSMALGNLTALYLGPAHAADNIMVWLNDQKILFGGCAVRAAEATTMGNTADGDLASWQIVVSTLAKDYADAKIVVPGHGAPAGLELLSHTHALLLSTMVD